MSQPGDASGSNEHPAVDLDLVHDPDATAEERAVDARLARLLAGRVLAVELPPSRVDLDAAKARVDAAQPRLRRRRAWTWAGAVAAAAAATLVVVTTTTGPEPRTGEVSVPATEQTAPATPSPRDTGPVPLRAGVPELPVDEAERLAALQAPGPLPVPTPPGPFSTTTTTVDCSRAEAQFGVRPAELDGLDGSGVRQVCATAAVAVGGKLGTDEVLTSSVLYRFYLPPGVDLDAVDSTDATEAGVSWTEVSLEGTADPITPDDRPNADTGGVTTVRWGAWEPALASVRRAGAERTELSWVEPHARSTSDGSSAVTVHAVVAAAPVTAVRAALGFVNQGMKQVLRGSDGTLLLVPTSPPQMVMQALGGGVLTRTPEGCLGFDDGTGGFQLVLWPYGSTWDSATQTLSVPATSGTGRRGEELRLGEDVLIGGGEVGSMAPLGLVPAACATEKTWVAGIS